MGCTCCFLYAVYKIFQVVNEESFALKAKSGRNYADKTIFYTLASLVSSYKHDTKLTQSLLIKHMY